METAGTSISGLPFFDVELRISLTFFVGSVSMLSSTLTLTYQAFLTKSFNLNISYVNLSTFRYPDDFWWCGHDRDWRSCRSECANAVCDQKK